MEFEQSLASVFDAGTHVLENVLQTNQTTEKFGLILSKSQAQKLLEVQKQAAKNTGRLEFGEGVIHKLAIAFCDSPYISDKEYEELLQSLIELFYELKNESSDLFSDDDLIEQMRKLFDRGFGSVELLQDTSIEQLAHNIRFDTVDDNVDDKLWMERDENEWD